MTTSPINKIALSLTAIFFICATSALAEDTPDANALFEQHENSPAKRKSWSFTGKADFVDGANEVIDAMKNNHSVITTFAGLPSHPRPWIDEEFGVEMNATGCSIQPQLETKNAGRRAALLWYASRGSYPVNSNKPHKPLDKVPQSKWSTFSEALRMDLPGKSGKSLVLTQRKGGSYMQFEPLTQGCFYMQWYWTVPPTEILWTLDKASNNIWLDIPAPYNADHAKSIEKKSHQIVEIDPASGLVLQTRDSDGNLF